MQRGGVADAGKQNMGRSPLIADFILSGALCASLAYWGMHFFTPQARPPAASAEQVQAALPHTDAAALLFGGQTAASAARNVVLTGVIADGPRGVAVLTVDGKPPQVVGLGMEAAPGVMVTEVNTAFVLLSVDGMIKRIDLPEGIVKAGVTIAAPVTMVNSKPAPARHRLVMHPTNGQAEGAPTQVMIVNNAEVPSQELRFARPSGMGPGARGAKMTILPPPATPAVQDN
jgi:general secretion pathway protein C